MPKKGGADRLRNYITGLNPERIKQDIELKKETMAAKQAKAFNDLATIEDKVKAVLAAADVSTVTYVWYYDFARSVYRLQNTHGGGKGLEKEVELLIYVWKERGADEDLLKKIRFDVFAIQEP